MADGVPITSERLTEMLTENILDSELDVGFDFHERPSPMSADLRPEWRIGAVLLSLTKCYANRANLRQLHVLNWALRTPESRQTLIRILNGELSPDEAIVRFDPTLERALRFAEGEKLITASGEMVFLTEKGLTLVSKINSDDDCLHWEKDFLKQIRAKISQKRVDAFLNWEGKRS
jgi:hypothetical protein